jgi:hypothetical protein
MKTFAAAAFSAFLFPMTACESSDPASERGRNNQGGQSGQSSASGGQTGNGGQGARSGGTSGGAGSAGGMGGSAGTGGTPGDAGPTPNDGGSNDGAQTMGPPSMPMQPRVCSDSGQPPAPVAGFTKAMPVNQKFPFSTHFMGIFSDNPRCISMTSLTDLDGDGDYDFASGQRDVQCSGATPGAPMIWWEHCTADHWVKHTVGTGYRSAAAGGAADFDNDGHIDLVVGDSWFRNPGATVRTAAQWMRYPTGAPGTTEEITMGDLDGDGRLDVLHVVQTIRPQWWRPGPDATKPWMKGGELPYSQQQGGAIADLDGDGKNDIIVGDRWWYRAGAGGTFMQMPIPDSTFAPGAPANGSAPLVVPADLDGDGDVDLLVQQHWGSRVAWFENADGKGGSFTTHMLVGPGGPYPAKARNILHGLLANDFDNDGDVDILSGENQGSIWIYENMDGKGTFVEHLVAMGPAHEPRAADVDCDGDLDIVGKSWGDPGDRAAGGSETIRAHVYYQNELVERGGPALFQRPRGEIWNVPDKGLCKR